MNRLSAAALALALASSGALAQDLVAPDGSLVHRSKLETACSESLARFCPDLTGTPGQTRNQVICLKPYRSSLPRYCRSLVNAALK